MSCREGHDPGGQSNSPKLLDKTLGRGFGRNRAGIRDGDDRECIGLPEQRHCVPQRAARETASVPANSDTACRKCATECIWHEQYRAACLEQDFYRKVVVERVALE